MTISHDPTNHAHRATCAECTALWTDLERISAEAARLPHLSPSRDLWAGIEARLDAAGGAPAAPRSARRWLSSPTVRLAIAASLLVAVSSAVTWQLATGRGAAASVTDLATLPAASTEDAELHLAAFSATVSSMDTEIASLQAIVTERSSELDPRTVEVLKTNLAVIDAAIAESRAALASDPASQFLADQFTRAYTSKLTLLRDAVTLPIGI
jgi:hypothetical protein